MTMVCLVGRNTDRTYDNSLAVIDLTLSRSVYDDQTVFRAISVGWACYQ